MKITLIILIIILILGAIIYLIIYKNKSSTTAKHAPPIDDTTETGVHKVKENFYEKLRDRAFSIQPSQLGISIYAKIEVFGVISEWQLNGVTITLVAYQTGDASMYFSSGAMVIGGGRHQNVNTMAKQFVRLAQPLLNIATQTQDNFLPESHEVNFYLLSNEGIFKGNDTQENLQASSSPWSELFNAANQLITQLRLTT